MATKRKPPPKPSIVADVKAGTQAIVDQSKAAADRIRREFAKLQKAVK